jgi:hypothetical protein
MTAAIITVYTNLGYDSEDGGPLAAASSIAEISSSVNGADKFQLVKDICLYEIETYEGRQLRDILSGVPHWNSCLYMQHVGQLNIVKENLVRHDGNALGLDP